MKRKSFNQDFSICAALILVFLTSGCATKRMYVGQELPKEQTAVIRGSRNLHPFFRPERGALIVKILCVNEEPIIFPTLSLEYWQTVEVKPGLYRVVVESSLMKCGDLFTFPSCSTHSLKNHWLDLNVEAGREYRIGAKDWWKTSNYIVVEETKRQ